MQPADESVDVVATEPPAEPVVVRPPRSTLAAALLNLTGLGLGYAYLGRRLLAVSSVVVTAALLTGAFLADAATAPWLWRGIVLGWLVLAGTHAALLARRHPRPAESRSRLLPAVAGLGAVVVVVAGYLLYAAAGRSAYADGRTALSQGDCAAAIDRFDAVTGFYELTLSRDVAAAAADREECAAFLSAATAQYRGDHAEAVKRYQAFGREFPGSRLAGHVHTNLARAYVDNSRQQTEPFTMPGASEAVNTLLTVRREFDDTPSAAEALDAIADAYAAATVPYEDGQYCEALPALTYFAGLDASSAGNVVAPAGTARATAMLNCGLGQMRSGDVASAANTLDTFVHAYPRHRAFAQAKSAFITARVAEIAKVKLPVPPPYRGDSPGFVPFLFFNDSNREARILLAGPTTHDITIPACRTCPAGYPDGSPKACAELRGLPFVRLALLPGKYHYITEEIMTSALVDSVVVKPDFLYEHCIYDVQ